MVNAGTRADQKRQTHLVVLAAARAEFEALGFDGTTLRGVARRAGVAAGTVVHHFGTKPGLLHAAFYEDLDAVLRRALAEPGPGPLQARLGRVTRAMFGHYIERPGLSRIQLKEALFAASPWAERFGGQVHAVHRAVAGWTRAAIDEGELASHADPAMAASSYLSFYYFALLGWAGGSVQDPAALVDALLAHHLGPWQVEGRR